MHNKIREYFDCFWKGDVNMSITATELKTNLGKYLMLAEKEDIYITRNGKVFLFLMSNLCDVFTRAIKFNRQCLLNCRGRITASR